MLFRLPRRAGREQLRQMETGRQPSHRGHVAIYPVSVPTAEGHYGLTRWSGLMTRGPSVAIVWVWWQLPRFC